MPLVKSISLKLLSALGKWWLIQSGGPCSYYLPSKNKLRRDDCSESGISERDSYLENPFLSLNLKVQWSDVIYGSFILQEFCLWAREPDLITFFAHDMQELPALGVVKHAYGTLRVGSIHAGASAIALPCTSSIGQRLGQAEGRTGWGRGGAGPHGMGGTSSGFHNWIL